MNYWKEIKSHVYLPCIGLFASACTMQIQFDRSILSACMHWCTDYKSLTLRIWPIASGNLEPWRSEYNLAAAIEIRPSRGSVHTWEDARIIRRRQYVTFLRADGYHASLQQSIYFLRRFRYPAAWDWKPAAYALWYIEIERVREKISNGIGG